MVGDRRGRTSAAGNASEKTLRVLEAAAGGGAGSQQLNDIAAKAAVPKPTAHRLLLMLAANGYLVAEGGGRYRIGSRLLALAARISANGTRSVDELLHGLQGAVDGHTVHLGLRSGDHVTYIRKIDSDHPYQMVSRVGMEVPLHCTAIGKCILAQLPDAEVKDVLAGAGQPARTPATVTTPDRMLKDLAEVRERGYAVDNEENEATIRCIASPVLDAEGRPLGGVSVSTVVFLVSLDQIHTFAPHLRATARSLSGVLR